jgi:cell division protein FtsQ
MWDSGRLLRAAAGFVVGFAALALVAGGTWWLSHSAYFRLRSIELCSILQHAPREQIEAVMARHAGGNFFAAPIDELRAALERLPWVRKAGVRRVWPDRLEVTIEEHVALARWGADALVNAYGERFNGAAEAELPLLSGPPGSEAEVTRRYLRFAELVRPLASPIERVSLSARHAWQVRLANGVELKLGRDGDAAERRLARFIDAYGARSPAAAGAQIDLRYPNGFALRLKS